MIKKREWIFDDVDSRIEACLDKIDHIKSDEPVEKKRLTRKISELYNLTNPEHEYSAIYATEILQHPYYNDLINKLKENHLWDYDLRKLEKQAKEVSLSRD